MEGYIWVCLLSWSLQMSSKEINSIQTKLTQLQQITHQQQDNLSQQLSEYRNFPVEESFSVTNLSLLNRQGQMAIKLCQELIIHTSEEFADQSDQICCFWFRLMMCYIRIWRVLPMTSNDATINLQKIVFFFCFLNMELDLGNILGWYQSDISAPHFMNYFG